MVKIIKKKSIGLQPVYDIGVEKDHNFILANGLVASNCFNKSHSTAYAYVTYQTAYLKANYPVEYMSALLTASSDNHDKVEKYRENCLKMGIDVKPPNINYSQKEFTPQGKNILFGLSAVKNLGEAAIDNIIEVREKVGGTFKDFTDFINKINLKTVNRRALETLIYAGAFDCIHNNRRQLIEGLDMMITWSQKKIKEKETGQLNIFEQMLSNNQEKEKDAGYTIAPQLPKIEDFSSQEKLKFEKENLGFYVSEHPLKPLKDKIKILSPVNLSELPSSKSRQKICALVILTSVKSHIDKNNNNMAFLTLEDINTQADGIIFASNYEQVKNNLIEDTPLIIWGKAEQKNDKLQIIINYMSKITDTKLVFITLNPENACNISIQNQLKGILQEQSGDKNQAVIPTFIVLEGLRERVFIRLGENYWVQDAYNTLEALKNASFDAYLQGFELDLR